MTEAERALLIAVAETLVQRARRESDAVTYKFVGDALNVLEVEDINRRAEHGR